MIPNHLESGVKVQLKKQDLRITYGVGVVVGYIPPKREGHTGYTVVEFTKDGVLTELHLIPKEYDVITPQSLLVSQTTKIVITIVETVTKSTTVEMNLPVDKDGMLDTDLAESVIRREIEAGNIILGEDTIDDVDLISISFKPAESEIS